MISAGRVLIVPRGEWNAETTYHMLDLVNHKGYAYLAKRTVVGIEPSDEHYEYWHNMLDINKIVAEAMASTLAEEVSVLLKDELSEARYVTDLLTEFDVPAFVHWNSETANTPYTEGLTTISHGYALVEGSSLTAWADGKTFTYGANGWDKAITSSGGTMSGPLGLGGGTGSVSADEEGAFLEAFDLDVSRQLRVEAGASLEEAVEMISKAGGVISKFSLFGAHNPNKIAELGFAKIVCGTYVGTGKSYRDDYINSLTFEDSPQLVLIFMADIIRNSPDMIMVRGCDLSFGCNTHSEDSFEVSREKNKVYFEGNTVSWHLVNKNTSPALGTRIQQNEKDEVYFYIAFVNRKEK